MRFFVSEIRNAGAVEHTAALDPRIILGQPPEYVDFHNPLDVKVKASISSTDIVVSGHIETKIGFVCARCLENFERPVAVDFQQVFGLDLQEFDVTNDIREAVYIELPLTPVCKEECQGLCSACGKNKNVSPCLCNTTAPVSKWDVLKEFRSYLKRS